MRRFAAQQMIGHMGGGLDGLGLVDPIEQGHGGFRILNAASVAGVSER